MAYSAPAITAAGLTIPSYTDIRNYLVQQFQNIYGQNAYLGNDSADYQWLSVVSLKLADAANALQLVYNNRSPLSAIGAALDGLVKLNGLARLIASYSSCQVVLTGVNGTVILNGIVGDVNGYFWTLPSSVTIPSSGNVAVVAVCQTIGSINALPNQINIMSSGLTAGWTGVNNSVGAVVGQPVETDAELRGRQSISVALPSQTRFQGTLAAIAAVSGVTRYSGIENPTGSPDQYDNPAHSISMVAEGGAEMAIASAIYLNKSPGCYTNGTTAVVVTDPTTGLVQAQPIRFTLPSYFQFTVAYNIHPLTGFMSVTQAAIKAAIVTYLNSLQIGELVTLSGIDAAVLALVGSPTQPLFSIRGRTLGYTNLITATPTITAGGSGYSVGDELVIAQSGSSLNATVQVATESGGAVTGVTLIQNGVDYTTATGVPTVAQSPSTGSGCTLSITAGTAQQTLDTGVPYFGTSQGVTGNVTINLV